MEGVSIIVGCMNRNNFLVRSLSTWLVHKEIKEVVIVDWGSNVDLKRDLQYVEDSRVKIVRVGGVTSWILGLALNLGANRASYPILLKLDADTVLRKNFFQQHPMRRNHFYTGNWRTATNENEKHLNGVIMVHRANFLAVNGYNEHIRTYGWDDSDLYERLETSGLKRCDLYYDTISHIQHNDDIRAPVKDLRLEITKNMHLAKKLPWVKQTQTQYVLIESTNTFEDWEVVNLETHNPNNEVVADCRILAMRTILNTYGYTWEMTRDKTCETIVKLYSRRLWPKFVICPKNGLGNRLRALASAAIIAESTKHNLVVEWIADSHYQAEMEAHFDISELIVSKQTCKLPCKIINGDVQSGLYANPLTVNNQDIYIQTACVISHHSTSWQKESDWLRKLRLPKLIDKINSLSKHLNIRTCIGLHIRIGQDAEKYSFESSSSWDEDKKQALAVNRKISHYNNFYNLMLVIWSRYPNQRFFLCADDESVYSLDWINDPRIVTVARNVYDRSESQLSTAIIDAWLLGRCPVVYGSPWSSFTELAIRIGQQRLFVSGMHFASCRKYAVMCYPDSGNLGDDVQTIAAEGFLPQTHYLVCRDDQSRILDMNSNVVSNAGTDRIKIIENGWFDGRLFNCNFNNNLDLLFISFHLNETDNLFQQKDYKPISDLAVQDKLVNRSSDLDKLRRLAEKQPIGTRDMHTLNLLQKHNINCYHSSCLTLTLQSWRFEYKPCDVLVVDAHIQEPLLYQILVPDSIKKRAKFILHGFDRSLRLSMQERHKRAYELLCLYRSAKLVITSRLHCALPCLAFNTPCLFLHSKMRQDVRFDDTLTQLLGNGDQIPWGWDWDEPHINPHAKQLANQLSAKLRKTVDDYVN